MLEFEDATRVYPDQQHQRTHSPPSIQGRDGYAAYRNCLRAEFAFTCLYCLILEQELRKEKWGGFEIEHFRPKGHREFENLRNAYHNLFWACRACNKAKHDRWPTRQQLRAGERFINPCDDVMANHLRIDGERIEALTAAGTFMIEQLGLDEALHRSRRADRIKATRILATIEALLENPAPDADADQLNALRLEVAAKRHELGLAGPPSDAPTTCLCPLQVGLFSP